MRPRPPPYIAISNRSILARFSHTASRREAGEGPWNVSANGYEARAAWRAQAYLDSPLSTASQRNEVDAA